MTDSPEPRETETTETTETSERGSQPADEKTLDRVADKFAKRAGNREEKYDQEHDNNFKI